MRQIFKIIFLLISMMLLFSCIPAAKDTYWEVVKTFKSLEKISSNSDFSNVYLGFLNDKIGFAINKGNRVYYSDDGGERWTENILNVSPCLSGIDILDENNIIIGSACSNLQYSNDKGSTWNNIEEKVYQIFDFYNNGSGLIAQNFFNKSIKILENFKSYKEIMVPEEYRKMSIAAVSCISANEVYLLFSGKGYLLKTKDGGETWEKNNLDKIKDKLIFQQGTTSMRFVDSNNGTIITYYPKNNEWIGLYTKDGGESWVYSSFLKANKGLKSYISNDGNYLTIVNSSDDKYPILLFKRKI